MTSYNRPTSREIAHNHGAFGWFLLVATGLFVFSSLMPARAADARRTDELMVKSGLHKQLAQIQAQVKAGALESRKQPAPGGKLMSDQDHALMMSAMERVYAPAPLQARMRSELEQLLAADDENAALAWLSSDLGRKFTKLEEEAGEVEEALRVEREAPAYAAKVPQPRMDKFRRMVDSMRAGEGMASLVINMTAAVAYGMALANPTGDPESLARTIRDQIEPQRAQMANFFTQQMLQLFAFIYRDVSDAELERYVAFAESPAGRRYHEGSIKALDNLFARASIDLGRQFEALRKQPARRS